MKRYLLATVVLGVLTVFSGTAMAIPLATVGAIDQLLGWTKLPNSDPDTEEAWVETVLGFDVTFEIKDEAFAWQSVDGYPGVYATGLTENPEYFLVKTGKISNSPDYREFLFKNLADLGFAVIDFGALGPYTEIVGVGKVSHITEFNGGDTQVPEPATLLLLGSGLLGLGLLRRRRN